MSNALYDTAAELADWQALRRTAGGASEAAGLLGVPGAFGSPLSIFFDKVADGPPALAMTDVQRWGLLLEPALARAYEERFGLTLRRPAWRRHPECDVVAASVDWIDETGAIVQGKTSHPSLRDRWGDEDTDEVPDAYNVQVQQEMAVYEVDYAVIWVAFWAEFRRYIVPRNEAIVRAILDGWRRFWDEHVRPRRAPDPDYSHPGTADLLNRLHVARPGTRTRLPAEVQDVAREYQALGVEVAALENQRKSARARLLNALGEFETGEFPDGSGVRRKLVTRRAHEVQESSYHDLRTFPPPKPRK